MDVSACYVDRLPDNILVKIFDHFTNSPPPVFCYPPYDPPAYRILLKRVRLVCRRWNELAFSPELWQNFSKRLVEPNSFSPEFSSFFHRIAPAIECFKVHIWTTQLPSVWLRFPQLPKLTRLVVSSYPTTVAVADSMVKLCPNVTFATFHSCGLGDEHLQIFASGWKHLAKLDVSDCPDVTGAGLLQFVSVRNRLESININLIPSLTDSDIDLITGVLGTSLKSIRFGLLQENLTRRSLQAIIKNCPQLEEICPNQPMYIGDLKHLTNLRSLRIATPTFGGRPQEGFAECFSRTFPHLRSLRIFGNISLNDPLLELIANSCPALETLDITTNRVTHIAPDAGLNEIVDKCRCLTSLSLSGFPCLTGRSFIGAREKLPRLRFLRFQHCRKLDVQVVKTEFAGVEGMKMNLFP